MAAEVVWMLGRTNSLYCSCIQLPLFNLLAGAVKERKLLFRPRCEALAILAAASADAKVALLFAANRRLPCTGTDQQASDNSARGAINCLILGCCKYVTNDTKHDDGLNYGFVRPNV